MTDSAIPLSGDFCATILETVGALVVVLDPRGRIAGFNKACERATGYAFEEVREGVSRLLAGAGYRVNAFETADRFLTEHRHDGARDRSGNRQARGDHDRWLPPRPLVLDQGPIYGACQAVLSFDT